jgi:cell division protein FtsB
MKGKLFTGLIILFGLYLIVSFSRDIWGLLNKTKEIDKEQQKLEDLKADNVNLKQQLEYVKSDAFVEKEARDKLGMAKDGEAVVLMPENVSKTSEDQIQQEEAPNWKKWWQLFF